MGLRGLKLRATRRALPDGGVTDHGIGPSFVLTLLTLGGSGSSSVMVMIMCPFARQVRSTRDGHDGVPLSTFRMFSTCGERNLELLSMTSWLSRVGGVPGGVTLQKDPRRTLAPLCPHFLPPLSANPGWSSRFSKMRSSQLGCLWEWCADATRHRSYECTFVHVRQLPRRGFRNRRCSAALRCPDGPRAARSPFCAVFA